MTKTTIRNGNVRYWDVYRQAWTTELVSEISDTILATLTDDERGMIARSRAASAMGRASTPRKAKAARANGRKGGRPAKSA